ncbi:50S ribosomal protein L25 [Clostridium magnum]|uniref:Large ribosomal subunit protein bL25 n=1 Tax=Clostridium magnum DSM 2767 TaxID=1121326 RepID=A0A161XGI4_9CLOT|nr:50S ribosomal protein L25 [Clostridium magnum]KZL93716.1 general stress protein CTC [Clostridium magnum DSM 2767]SHI09890.1 LSU ribosomal protein L25P [Clostridium magnum DSM 2767]
MESIILHKRIKKTSHEAKKERRKGLIPGIIYGKNINNMMFEIGELELNKEITRSGEHGVLSVNLDGESHKALIKEIQRDPVHHKITHIDLAELPENTVVQTEVPIVFNGEDLIMKKGGAVQKEKSNVKVQCKGESIPKFINVDLSKLDIGDSYRIGDIEMAGDISIIEDFNSIIASVTMNKKPSDIEVETEE